MCTLSSVPLRFQVYTVAALKLVYTTRVLSFSVSDINRYVIIRKLLDSIFNILSRVLVAIDGVRIGN
jgi:hypothetical protein